MAKNAFVILSVLVWLIFSCDIKTQSHSEESIGPDTLFISDEDNSEFLDLYTYFDRHEVIPLETKQESILNRVDKVYFHKDLIFILDRIQNGVFIFNEEGKFVFNVINIGKGPGEYLSLTDVVIDEDQNQIVLYADRPGKVIFLNLDGSFIREEVVSGYQGEMILSDEKLAFFKVKADVENYFSTFGRESGNLLTNSERIPSLQRQFTRSKVYPLISHTNNGSYCCGPLDNHLFHVNDGKIDLRYVLDFGEHNLPESFPDFATNENVFNICINNDYGSYVNNFMEFPNLIAFQYLSKKWMVLYDKKTGQSEITHSLSDPITNIHINSFISHNSNDNFILTVKEPRSYILQAKYFPERMSDDLINSDLVQVGLSIKETDNPVLIKYYLKE